MVTLYKRATPSQKKLLRIVAGAYKNVCHAHNIEFDPLIARSIAKRATGTASSQWRELLAANIINDDLPSGMAGDSAAEVSGAYCKSARPRNGAYPGEAPPGKGGRLTFARRPPLRFLHNKIGHMAGQARKSGDLVREEALVEVLRIIAVAILDSRKR